MNRAGNKRLNNTCPPIWGKIYHIARAAASQRLTEDIEEYEGRSFNNFQIISKPSRDVTL